VTTQPAIPNIKHTERTNEPWFELLIFPFQIGMSEGSPAAFLPSAGPWLARMRTGKVRHEPELGCLGAVQHLAGGARTAGSGC
jgi:hypothetical protein